MRELQLRDEPCVVKRKEHALTEPTFDIEELADGEPLAGECSNPHSTGGCFAASFVVEEIADSEPLAGECSNPHSTGGCFAATFVD